jgi:hypothetical protein
MNQKPTRTLGVFSWSIIDNLSGTGINFLVSLILARLLGPDIYGIIGVALIFVALSNVLIDGGFSNSLIRKESVTTQDYNTVFVINVSTAFLIYGLSFILSPIIASFFSNTQLTQVIRVICISVIIGSFSIVPKVWLTRNLDFKRQAIASILSSTFGAIAGITLVFGGYGIWALVAQQLIRQSLYTLILVFIVPQRPHFRYSSASANSLFGYGSRILLSGIIDSLYNNLYLFVIGKVFSPRQLGLYSRAEQFSSLISVNFSIVLQRTTLPMFAKCLSNGVASLEHFYLPLIRKVTFLSLLCMLSICAIANNIIMVILGSAWLESTLYLRILCFAALFQPMIILNQNILQTFGYSQLFLKIEIFKKVLSLFAIASAFFYGITTLLWMMVGVAAVSFIINGYFAAIQLPGIQYIQQLKSFIVISSCAAVPPILAYTLGTMVDYPALMTLVIQSILIIISSGLTLLLLSKVGLIQFSLQKS